MGWIREYELQKAHQNASEHAILRQKFLNLLKKKKIVNLNARFYGSPVIMLRIPLVRYVSYDYSVVKK